MAGQPVVTIEGDELLTKRLASLEAKMQRQVLTKAAKACGALVKKDYQSRVPVDSGAMRASVRVRVRRYKHKAATGKMVIARGGRMAGQLVAVKRVVAEDIGANVYIDPRALKKQVGKRSKGAVRIFFSKDKKGKTQTSVFYYPTIVELGGRNKKGARPLTKSLYLNGPELRDVYLGNLRALVARAGSL
jgi:hypothetical protein